MEVQLLTSVDKVKDRSIISGNLDPNKLRQFIEIAQEEHIQNFLGTRLYEKLMSLVSNGTIDDAENVNYKFLLQEHVDGILVWHTQAVYLPFSSFQVTNGGVYKHTSQNGELASGEEVARLTQKCLDRSDFKTRRMLDYLCNNSNNFLEYRNNQNEDMYPDKEVNYKGGFFI